MTHVRQLAVLVVQDLRARWSGGVLTWAWALIQPGIQIALYAVVFSAIMVPRGGDFPAPGLYVVYLCGGVFCWLGFSESLARGSQSFLEAATLIRGRNLPLALLPLRSAGSAWILALVGFAGTLVIAPLAGVQPRWAWLLLPLPVLSLALLSAGLGMALAPLTVLARDTVQVVHLCLPLAFWATPIVYAPGILPPWAQAIQAWNPLLPAIDGVHRLLLHGEPPTATAWLLMLAIPATALLLGWGALARLGDEARDCL